MCDCINPFAWLLESIREGVTLDELKAQGLVGEGVTLEELLPRCMCGSSVPAQRDTDTAPSERAQVVEDAVREDELHDFLLNVVEVADMFGVPIIWAADEDDEWEAFEDSGFEGWNDDYEDYWEYDWDYMDYGDYLMSISDSQPLNHAGWRTHQKNWRRRAISLGFKPEVVAYELAPDIRTFEGEVYRVINPADFNYDDIPF